MTLIGSTLLIEARKLLGSSYTDVRCHDLILKPLKQLGLFGDSPCYPVVPLNHHEDIDSLDVRVLVDEYGKRLIGDYNLVWWEKKHDIEPGDILLLRVNGSRQPCHLAWAASPRGPARHMLHAWNPDPTRPQLGSVRFDLVHPRVFTVDSVARISA